MADIQMKTVRDSGYRESSFGITSEDLEQRGSRNATRGSTGRGSTFKRQFVINNSRESNYMLDEEEEDAGNVPFMNNPTLSSQDVSDTRFNPAKLLGEDILKAKSQLRLVHAINMLLFGDGKYMAVPICWLVLQFAVLIYRNVLFVEGNKLCAQLLSQKAQVDAQEDYICETLSSYILTSTHFAYAINLTASLYFGWRTSKMVYVDKVLAGHCHKLAPDARDQARRMLNRMIMSSVLFFTGFYVVYNSANHIVGAQVVFRQQALGLASLAIPKLFAAIDVMVEFIFYLSTFYIVGLWIWVTWIKSKVNQDLAQSTSVEGIMDDSFIASFLHIYTTNAKKSMFWSVNHIVRVLTCVPYAWYTVSVGRFLYLRAANASGIYKHGAFGNEVSSVSLIVVGLAFYLVIWLSIAAGGFVNDSGYYLCALAVSELVFTDDESQTAEKNAYDKERFERLRNEALNRMDVIRSTTGINFAGVLLSVQKSVAIGSLLLTLMGVAYR